MSAYARSRGVTARVLHGLLVAAAGLLVCGCVPIGFKAQNMFAALIG